MLSKFLFKLYQWSLPKTKSPPEEPEPEPEEIFIHFSIHPDSHFYFDAYWPIPENDEEASTIARNLASSIHHMCQGGMLPYMQEAVAKFGHESGTNSVAREILSHLNSVGLNKKNTNGPVVDPEMVFGPSQNEKGNQ